MVIFFELLYANLTNESIIIQNIGLVWPCLLVAPWEMYCTEQQCGFYAELGIN